MSRLIFLAHSQLHEVLFSFLEPKDVLAYRNIHSECDTVVRCHARTQLRDVVGQNFLPLIPLDSEGEKIVPRTIDASFVTLLKACGEEDIAQLLVLSTSSIALSAKLICGASDGLVLNALAILCDALAHAVVENVEEVHLDLSGDIDSVGRSSSVPQSNLAVDTVTDDIVKLLAERCLHLRSLNVSFTNGKITDESLKLVALNCPQCRRGDHFVAPSGSERLQLTTVSSQRLHRCVGDGTSGPTDIQRSQL